MMTRYILEHRGERVARRRHVALQRPDHRHRPPARRRPDVPGLRRRRGVLLGRQHLPTRTTSAAPSPAPSAPTPRTPSGTRPRFPPFKIVEGNKIVADMEALYRRCSRTPGEPLARPAGDDRRQQRRRARGSSAWSTSTARRVVKGVMRRGARRQPARLRSRRSTRSPTAIYSDRLIQEVSMNGRPRHLPGADHGAQEGPRADLGQRRHPRPGRRDQRRLRRLARGDPRLDQRADAARPDGLHRRRRAALQASTPNRARSPAPDWGAAVSPAGVYATETAISLGNALVSKMMLASSDETMRGQRGHPRRRPVALPLRRRRQPARRLLRRRHGRQHARRRAARPAWSATANSPTATSGSRRAAAPTSRPTRPTGRSSTSSAASTPTPAAPGASAPATAARSPTSRTRASPFLGLYTTEGIPKTPGIFGGNPAIDHAHAGDPGLRDPAGASPPARCRRTSTSSAARSWRSAARATASRSATTTSSTGTGSAAGRLRRPADARPASWWSRTSPPARSARRAPTTSTRVKLRGGAVDDEATAQAARAAPARTAARGGRRARRAGAGASRCRPTPRRSRDAYLIDRDDDRHRAATAAPPTSAPLTANPKQGMACCERPISSLSPGATRTRASSSTTRSSGATSAARAAACGSRPRWPTRATPLFRELELA